MELANLHEENREMRSQIEASDRKVKQLEKAVQLMEIKIQELEQNEEATSYDGIFTWKISDFARRREDAISGSKSSFYSPPFYTSRAGKPY